MPSPATAPIDELTALLGRVSRAVRNGTHDKLTGDAFSALGPRLPARHEGRIKIWA